DRVSAIIQFDDVTMEVFDTGGIGIVDVEDLSEHIEHQIQAAVSGANVILFVTDGREGVTALDRTVAERLRPRAAEIPVLLVVNNIDDPHLEPHILDFWERGVGEPHPESAMPGYGRGDILEEIVSRLGPTGDVSIEPVMTLAVIGRQNAGKSTFVTALA